MKKEINLSLIKKTRQNLRLTQQDMAEILGLNDKSKYSRRENGEYSFRLEELPVLVNTLQIPYEKIFTSNVAENATKRKEATHC